MQSNEYLFRRTECYIYLQKLSSDLLGELNTISQQKLLNTNIDEMVEYYYQKYYIEPVRVMEELTTIDHKEVDIDVRYDSRRFIPDKSKPFNIRGTQYTYYVPFEGNSDLFFLRASTFTSNPPTASISSNKIVIQINQIEHNIEQVKQTFSNTLSSIKTYIDWVLKDIAGFNTTLKNTIYSTIERRANKAKADIELSSKLGFPLIERKNTIQSYAVPLQKKRILPPLPKETVRKYVPEPYIEMEHYENILSIISNMVQVIEYSPSAFHTMKEEDLRQHFLVQLNGQYEGQASGETFNYEGKTDILLRQNGRNLFIAECKFWTGAGDFTDIIDQILGYLSWRDSKAAILLFNKNKDMSKVVSQIPELCSAHPNFVRKIEYHHESGYRFTMHQKNDNDKHITVTVLVFDLSMPQHIVKDIQ